MSPLFLLIVVHTDQLRRIANIPSVFCQFSGACVFIVLTHLALSWVLEAVGPSSVTILCDV